MKVVLTTGLTGGHLFPALAFGSYLKERHSSLSILYVANERIKQNPLLFDALKNETVFFLPNNPFTLKKILSFLLGLIGNFKASYSFLKKEKPSAVIGFGSNLAFPMVMLAFFLRIPRALHEQNVSFGKANYFLAPFVDVLALSFPHTSSSRKAVWTGNFLRPSLQSWKRDAAEQSITTEDQKLSVLVLGGSQGAAFINQTIIDVLESLTPTMRKKIFLRMVVGKEAAPPIEVTLQKLNVAFEVYEYSNQMELLYSKTDLLIARSGAGTIFEALHFSIPAIYIPYPHAGTHQYENAAYFEKLGAAYVLRQSAETEERLRELLKAFLLKKGQIKRKEMQEKMKTFQEIQGLEVFEKKMMPLLQSKEKEKVHVTTESK